jgi:hypothetical protein
LAAPGTIQASQTAFISEKADISVSQTVADKTLLLSVCACARGEATKVFTKRTGSSS